jgi:hypothetical protein
VVEQLGGAIKDEFSTEQQASVEFLRLYGPIPQQFAQQFLTCLLTKILAGIATHPA